MCIRDRVKGVSIDWNLFYPENKPKKISLPTYPFEKKRYWFDNSKKPKNMPNIQNDAQTFTLQQQIDVADIKLDTENVSFSDQHLPDAKIMLSDTMSSDTITVNSLSKAKNHNEQENDPIHKNDRESPMRNSFNDQKVLQHLKELLQNALYLEGDIEEIGRAHV